MFLFLIFLRFLQAMLAFCGFFPSVSSFKLKLDAVSSSFKFTKSFFFSVWGNFFLLFSNKASACFLFKLSRLEKERLILRLLLMLFSSLIKVFLELLFSLLSDIAFGSFSFLSDVIFVLIFELAFLSLFARVTAKNFSESEEFW